MNALSTSLACAVAASAACGALVAAVFLAATAALPRPALLAAVLVHHDAPVRLPVPVDATLARASD